MNALEMNSNRWSPGRTAGAVAAVVFSASLGFALNMPAPAARADISTDALRACQRIEDRKARYLCYDTLEQSAPSPPPAQDSASGSQARRDFGLSGSQRQVKRREHITVQVVSARKNLSGNWIFRTEDGQAWRQTGSERVQFRDRAFQAEIRKAALGGYFLVPEGRRSRVRVKRIE